MFLIEPFEHREISSITSPDGFRTYTLPDGTSYPSVTTVIGRADYLEEDPDWKIKWVERVGPEEAEKISKRALARGRAIHGIAEKYLQNDPEWSSGLMSYIRADFSRVRPLLDRGVTKVRGNEVAVWSHRLKTAGRTDLVCEWEGTPAILDFKTSLRLKEAKKIPKYFVQAAAYSVMLEETYGVNTEKIVIFMLVDHDEPAVFVDSVRNWLPLVNRVFVEERPL